MTCVNVTRGVTQFLRLLKNTNTDLYLKRTMISITELCVTSNRIHQRRTECRAMDGRAKLRAQICMLAAQRSHSS